ncbi:MAG: hypothetical protein ACLP0J_28145 [Solirubrobacteraceae bacterium]
MIFTRDQVKAIRARRVTAVLAPCSERVAVGSVRLLRRCDVTAALARRPAGHPTAREVSAWIEARLDLDRAVEVVCDTAPDGERVAVCFTVLALADVDVEAVSLQAARACGSWTVAGLALAWAAEHPQMPRARLIWFALGDLRDAPLLVSRGWPDYTADPSRAMFAEPEPVGHAEQFRQAADARHRYLRSQADRQQDAAAGSIAERLAAIQRGTVSRAHA